MRTIRENGLRIEGDRGETRIWPAQATDVAYPQLGERVDDSIDHGSQRRCRTALAPERTPSLFDGEGTSLSYVAKNGSVSARGIP
jgi:hypothetical protein